MRGTSGFYLKLNTIKLPNSFSSPSHFVETIFMGRGSPGSLRSNSTIGRFFRVLSSITVPGKYILGRGNRDRCAHCSYYYSARGTMCCCAACSSDDLGEVTVGSFSLRGGRVCVSVLRWMYECEW